MHDVKALIADESQLRQTMAALSNAVICPLRDGFALVPITDGLAAELAQFAPSAEASWLPDMKPGVRQIALRISSDSPVAYVSTEYFGGDGGQDAMAWSQGEVIFSPQSQGYGEAWPNTSISRALRAIGVIAEQGKDEFDTLGLGRHRETHRWAEAYAST